MEVREMHKSAVNITLAELKKNSPFWDDSPTNKRKVPIQTSTSILRREGSILSAVNTVSFPFERASLPRMMAAKISQMEKSLVRSCAAIDVDNSHTDGSTGVIQTKAWPILYVVARNWSAYNTGNAQKKEYLHGDGAWFCVLATTGGGGNRKYTTYYSVVVKIM